MKSSINPTLKAYLYLIGGVLCLSISPLFFRWIDAPGVIISFYRMLFVSVVFAPYILFQFIKIKKEKKDEINRIPILFFALPILSGIASAFDLSIWAASINFTSVANAIVLNYTSPVWVAFFGLIFLNEKHRKFFWVGLVLVILGAVLISKPDFSTGQIGRGELLALVSSLFYTAYFLVTQKSRQKFSAFFHTWFSAASSTVILGILGIILGLTFFDYSAQTWLGFIMAGLISQFGGYFCMSQAMGVLPASIVSPFMVLQPVLSALLAIPLVGEPLSGQQISSGLIVILGIWLVTHSTISKNHS